MTSFKFILISFFVLLTGLAVAKDGWTVVIPAGRGPEVKVADKSAEWQGEDKNSVIFVLAVGTGAQEGHVKYELSRDKKIRTVEYGQWSKGKWMPGQKINEGWNDLAKHMTPVWEHFFPFE